MLVSFFAALALFQAFLYARLSYMGASQELNFKIYIREIFQEPLGQALRFGHYKEHTHKEQSRFIR